MAKFKLEIEVDGQEMGYFFDHEVPQNVKMSELREIVDRRSERYFTKEQPGSICQVLEASYNPYELENDNNYIGIYYRENDSEID